MMDGDGSEKEYFFSIYINPNRYEKGDKRDLDVSVLENIIKSLNPIGAWRVSKTWCGLLAAFQLEADALTLLNARLYDALGSSVQVAKFSAKDMPQKQVLLLRDVPWAVPLQEIKSTLERQGIFPISMERLRQNVKVEVSELSHYENLLRNGLDFFGVTRFTAVPERWRRPFIEMSPQDTVIQCYRCQNFWHIAAHCSSPPRCVRCGGPHSVETCTRPRSDPFCCHCGGPHHAAYRHCPVRLQVAAAPLGFPLPMKGNSR